MWCKNCNIETNELCCPVCGSITIEDLPTEVYWCSKCEVPVIQVATQADKGCCPLCAKKLKYLSTDLRPVFPVNANLKMSVFVEKGCHFSPDSIQVYTALTTTSLVGLKPVKP